MDCPSCNKPASALWAYAFSLQGVSVVKNLRGYLKCQHCGALLRVRSYGKQFWYMFIPAAILLIAFAFLFPTLSVKLGTIATATIWMFILILIAAVFGYGLWKFAVLQKVEPKAEPPAS